MKLQVDESSQYTTQRLLEIGSGVNTAYIDKYSDKHNSNKQDQGFGSGLVDGNDSSSA